MILRSETHCTPWRARTRYISLPASYWDPLRVLSSTECSVTRETEVHLMCGKIALNQKKFIGLYSYNRTQVQLQLQSLLQLDFSKNDELATTKE
jgi:hypothetical protein